MKYVLCLLCILFGVSASAQPSGAEPDVLFQGFYWNVHPGDHALGDQGGVWWDSVATVAPRLAAGGIQTVWIPSFSKGMGGRWSMGYDLYDYYDLGAIDQKGGVRTRFGNETQFRDVLATMRGEGLRIMADVVLNHRFGADAQSNVACVPGGGAPYMDWNVYTPLSGRFPADANSFHPNTADCDLNPPYHNAIFGQDISYFYDTNTTLGGGQAWYHGPHNLGAVGDSLVVFGRYLMDDLGVDEVRLDAIKHIDPAFLAPWIVEIAQDQPFTLGEFWSGTSDILNYHAQVRAFNTTFGAGSRDASMAMFDFPLRYALRDMANGGGGYDMRGLNSAGLHFSGLDAFDVVTFVENHDVDRIGFVWADCNTDPDAVPYGASCTKLGNDVGHDPIIARKHMAYAIMLASEGRPTVFWKDYLWYGLGDEIDWLMALRRMTGQGESTPLSGLAPFGANESDFWVLRREGFGAPRYGALLAVSDGAEEGAWVNSPHSDYELKDYSDAYAFETTRAFSDSRAYVKARGGDYAWWAPTGLYPRPMDEPASSFALTAEPGGALHHVVLRAQDAATLLVGGAPIQPGDEVAILAPGATVATTADVSGIGRVGQRLRWDGVHDMVIEVLGNTDGTNDAGRLKDGDALRLVVFDASTGQAAEAGSVTWAAPGGFTYAPLRPATRGGAFTAQATDDDGLYTAGAISLVTGFETTPAVTYPEDVRVTAIPYRPQPPIVIGSDNPRFRFKARTRNTTRDPRTEDIWTEIRNAAGEVVTTGFVPAEVVFTGRETIKNRFTQKISKFSPAGTYTFTLFVGQYPDAPQDTDSFTFEYTGPPTSVSASTGLDEGWALEVVTEPDEGLADDGLSVEDAAPQVQVWPIAPNPFRDRTTLRFALPEPQPVRVDLLDALGRQVRTLYDGTPPSGPLAVVVDGRDLPSGLYLVRLTGDGVAATQRVLKAR
ncbi:MAG: alpha-amylase family glycosyl hydrolase [Bacteroidota bacterium]